MLVLSSQPTAGHKGSWSTMGRIPGDFAMLPTMLHHPTASLTCSSSPKDPPLSQELWKESQVPSCPPTSNHPPRKET